MKEKLKQKFSAFNIDINESNIEKFEKFYNFLIETNKNLNLTAITDVNEVIEKHFIDSVLPEKHFSLNAKVIDIGSGAGFPAIPLKIVRPDLNITMLDSLNKRVNFQLETIKLLNLNNITAIHGRAEDMAKNTNFRESFDIATARAVANLSTLSEYCLPFVKVGGKFIVYKGANSEEEIKNAEKAISLLGGKIENVITYKMGDNLRTLVVINKVKNTPSLYPRGQNKPRIKPL